MQTIHNLFLVLSLSLSLSLLVATLITKELFQERCLCYEDAFVGVLSYYIRMSERERKLTRKDINIVGWR